MSLKAKLTLAASIAFTSSMIYYVHSDQNQLFKQINNTYKIAFEEKEKRKQQQEENRLFMIEQQKLTEILEKATKQNENK